MADKESLIGPISKVIEILSLLPSQKAESYMIEITKTAYEMSESDILLIKIAEIAVKK